MLAFLFHSWPSFLQCPSAAAASHAGFYLHCETSKWSVLSSAVSTRPAKFICSENVLARFLTPKEQALCKGWEASEWLRLCLVDGCSVCQLNPFTYLAKNFQNILSSNLFGFGKMSVQRFVLFLTYARESIIFLLSFFILFLCLWQMLKFIWFSDSSRI